AGYFAAMLFAEGATRAGARLTRESLIAALQSVKRWESGILPPLTIGPDHETQKQAVWVRVERGRFKQLTDWRKADEPARRRRRMRGRLAPVIAGRTTDAT